MNRTLSHSQVEQFAACPQRWYLTKIARAPQAPSEHLILGDAVHQAIQADGEKLLAGMPPLPLPLLTRAYRDAFHARLRSDDPGGLLAGQVPAIYQRGLAMLSAYARRVQPYYRPVMVEQSFGHDLPGAEGWRFTGRIDARTVPDGTATIVDFKTASKMWWPGDEHKREHANQTAAYLWAARVAGWQPAARRVTFIVLCGTEVSRRETPRRTEQTEEHIQRRIDAYVAGVRTTAEAITAALDSGEFPARPEVRFGARSQCCWCGVLGSCSVGQAWLREHQQEPVTPLVGAVVTAG